MRCQRIRNEAMEGKLKLMLDVKLIEVEHDSESCLEMVGREVPESVWRW